MGGSESLCMKLDPKERMVAKEVALLPPGWGVGLPISDSALNTIHSQRLVFFSKLAELTSTVRAACPSQWLTRHSPIAYCEIVTSDAYRTRPSFKDFIMLNFYHIRNQIRTEEKQKAEGPS